MQPYSFLPLLGPQEGKEYATILLRAPREGKGYVTILIPPHCGDPEKTSVMLGGGGVI